MRVVRLMWVGLAFRVKELTRSGLFIFTSVIEPAVGAAWTIVAYVLLRVFEAEGRWRATLETV